MDPPMGSEITEDEARLHERKREIEAQREQAENEPLRVGEDHAVNCLVS